MKMLKATASFTACAKISVLGLFKILNINQSEYKQPTTVQTSSPK